jgi:hypothetical protein
VISFVVAVGDGSVCAQLSVAKVRVQRKQTSILYINIGYNTDSQRKRAQIKDFSQPVHGVDSIIAISTHFSASCIKIRHGRYTGMYTDTTAMLHNQHT